MRLLYGALVGSLALGSVACEKRARSRVTETTASVLAEADTAAPIAPPVNVYRFVNAETTMTDARKAITEERWADALGAVNELLKKQPDNAEAQKMQEQAKLEGPALIRFGELNKALAQNDVGKTIKAWNAIPEASMYHARGQADFDKLKSTYVDNQENEARVLVRAGRCDDARHLARVTIEYFSDARSRLEDAASNCRPSRSEPSPAEIAAAEKLKNDKKAAAEEKKEQTTIGMAPLAPVPAPSPPSTRSERPEPERTSATIESKPKEEAKTSPTPAEPAKVEAAPAPKPTVAPKTVQLSELEPLRVAGTSKPNLPPAALMLARKDNQKILLMVVQACFSEKGTPTAVNLKKSTDYSEANDAVLSEVRKWRFKPYLMNGEAVPVCTAVIMQHKIEWNSKCGPRGSSVGNSCQD